MGSGGRHPAWEASVKSGNSNTPNPKERGSGMCFCWSWQGTQAAAREAGQQQESQLRQKGENKVTSIQSCGRAEWVPPRKGHRSRLPFIKVTFFTTRSDQCRTWGVWVDSPVRGLMRKRPTHPTPVIQLLGRPWIHPRVLHSQTSTQHPLSVARWLSYRAHDDP